MLEVMNAHERTLLESAVSAEDHIWLELVDIFDPCVEFSSSGAELYRQDVTQKTQMQISDLTNTETRRKLKETLAW